MLNETHTLTDIHTDFIHTVGNVSIYIFSITSINPTRAIINMNSVTIFRYKAQYEPATLAHNCCRWDAKNIK